MGILQGLFAGIPALSLLLAAVAGASEAQTIRLDLNVPAYRLSVLRGDTVVRMFRVAVGMRAFPTPVGTLEISDVTWNPWWHPPRSAWAQKDSILPPGPENPMGAVKLFIGGLYYLHGTPVDGSVGHAASHGCVRMHQSDAIALAQIVLKAQGLDSSVLSSLDSAAASNATVEHPLAEPIPIKIHYTLAEIRGDSLHMYPDIYRRRRGSAVDEALAVLTAFGVDTVSLDRAKLSALVKRSARQRVDARLSSLKKLRGKPSTNSPRPPPSGIPSRKSGLNPTKN